MDTNRNAAHSSETVLIADSPPSHSMDRAGRLATGASRRRRFTNSSTIFASRRAPSSYATTSGFIEKPQARLSRYDAFDLGIGARCSLGDWTLALRPYASWTALRPAELHEFCGNGVPPRLPLRPRLGEEGFANLRLGRQGFRPIDSDRLADDNSGMVDAA